MPAIRASRGYILLWFVCLLACCATAQQAFAGGPYRVVVSTDIGGSDPDDRQSLVHLLVCSDALDLEGLISSLFNQGSTKDILQVVDLYERDYANLKTYSDRYPTPAELRAMTMQGALANPGRAGFGESTEGSRWIVRCAHRDDHRPLHVLVWGSLSDVAQALHDDPAIEEKLRVYFIGGPNKMWNPDSYEYIEQHHPKLHMIENNWTYTGYYTGGDQTGEWGNKTFVAAHVAGHGALGEYFASLRDGELKMGDTPSVSWLLHGEPGEPSKPGWGGQFVRVWDGRKTVFDRPTSEADQVEACGVVEFALPAPAGFTRDTSVKVLLDDRVPAAAAVENDGRTIRFRFSPKSPKVWSYTIHSDFPSLDGQSGKFQAVPPPPTRTRVPADSHPNWWTDDPDPAAAQGAALGAKSVSRWRKDFLQDFATRMDRCKSTAASRP